MSDTVRNYIDENFKKTVRNNREDEGTLLGLPYPYTVPCPDDMFVEMYYWDTYFTNSGLIADGNVDLAKNNIDNMLYMVEKYGFMPNGNRTYYLTRSQPPFLYLGVKDVYETTKDKEWLKAAYNTLCKEYEFWQTKRKMPCGLNFYGNTEIPDSAVEKGYQYFLKRCNGNPVTDFADKKCLAVTMSTFCESGWDCNSRFEYDGQNYIPVDLNSLLYGFEKQMYEFCDILLLKDAKKIWQERYEYRKEKMYEYLWDEKQKTFLDYNIMENHFSPVVSAASLYPFFVGLTDNKSDFKNLFLKLFLKFGVSASAEHNTKGFQWDYPNIWPPVQYISYIAALNCGLNGIANDIKTAYVMLIEKSFKETDGLWEKYDGNFGTVANKDYNAPKMLGWTSGIYLYFTLR